MRYDCHLEVCSLTPRERVSAYLTHRKPSGVVYVQKGTDHRSRSAWMSLMGAGHGACGVVQLDPCDSNDGFAQLASMGVCAVLLAVRGSVSADRVHEQIRRLHDVLPRQWHIELEAPWATAALLAPLLARTDRVFCVTPPPTPDGANHAALTRMLWWLDMGNAYVKFTCAHVEECAARWVLQVCRSAPDRVVVGGGERLPRRPSVWWLGDSIPPQQVDDNARRLYPFFSTRPMH